MKIILNKTFQNLGKKGEIKNVADGFARNFLLPREIALAANSSNIAKITATVQEENKIKKESENKLVKIKDEIKSLSLKIQAKADDQGSLFGAVGRSEIQKALFSKMKVKIPRQKIDLEKSIKSLGRHTVNIQITPKSTVKIKLEIIEKEKS